MYAKCVVCLRSWNVSVLAQIPKNGYVCPLILLILSVLTLVLCLGGALMDSRIMDRLCGWLFDAIRGGVEYEDERL